MKHTNWKPGASGAPSARSETRLQGGWLVLVRSVWGGLALLTLIVCIASFFVYWRQLEVVCIQVPCLPMQPLPETARTLRAAGLTPGDYAIYETLLELLVTGVSWAVAAILCWRKSDDWLALLTAFFLVTMEPATQGGPLFVLKATALGWHWPVQIVLLLNVLAQCVLFFLFPTGRFVPRWTRWAALTGFTLVLPEQILPSARGTWPEVLATLSFVGVMAVILLAQIYRYGWVSTRL